MPEQTFLPGDICLEPQGFNIQAFASFFGKYEMELVAYLITKLLSKGNKWRPFTLREIVLVGQQEEPPEHDDYILEGWEWLQEYGWIIKDEGCYFIVTDDFIRRCKQRSDARKA